MVAEVGAGQIRQSICTLKGDSMRWGAVLLLFVAPRFGVADDLVIDRAVLTLIEHANVPAQQAGRIDKLLVHEGEVVQAGQPLVQLDDREARLASRRSRIELDSAKHIAADPSKLNAARKAAEKQRQVAVEQQIEFDVAQTEALNDVAVRAAAKSRDVANNEYQRGMRSREASKNSVSESTLDGLRLEVEKMTLAHEQAEFQLSVLKLKLNAKKAGMRTQALNVEAADLDIRETESLKQLAELQAELKRSDVDAAELNVAQRLTVSPIAGVVVELPRQTGEWVQPGEKVARVIRLSRLRAEGFLPLAKASSSLVGKTVTVEVATTERGRVARPGRITFVSPDVDPINQEVRVWAEFDNPEGMLLPGLRASIRIPDAGGSATAASR
jgi:multidrug efflux pump subunit AcrA (membrane-fusion protein)